jgi:hypothetical protein
MTLQEYASGREKVVLFFVGVGCPTGDHTVLGHPDLDFAERRGLLDLQGEVDEQMNWWWDGSGDPQDDNGSSIYNLHAYVDAQCWDASVQEYEADF